MVSTVHVLKDADGKVIKGAINKRVGTKRSMKWVKRNADLNSVYAVIRKRSVHKRTLEVHNVNFATIFKKAILLCIITLIRK